VDEIACGGEIALRAVKSPSTTADPGTVNPPTSDAPMIAAVSVLGACALGAVVFAAVCTKKRGAK